MNKLFRKNSGITLVALVVTIIVLLILAGVSLSLVLGENGIIGKAEIAFDENQKATDIEKIRHAQAEFSIDNLSGDIDLAEFIDYLDSVGIIDKEDAEFEDDNTVLVTLEDGYIYEITKVENGNIEINFVGKIGAMFPKLQISITDQSTNSITITPTVKRNNGGKLEYYIKEENQSDYQLKETTQNTSAYTFTSLTHNKTYNIKVVATSKQGLSTEAETIAVTREIVQPAVTFTYDPSDWTNGSVHVTASINGTEQSGMTLYIGESINSCNTLASTGITVTSNKTVYAVYKDDVGQYGAAAAGTVDKIDKLNPSIGSANGTTIVSGNTGTITFNSIEDTGGSGLSEILIRKDNTAKPNANDSGWIGNTNSTYSYNVTQAGEYYAWVKDKVGNISESYKSCTVTVDTATCYIDGITNQYRSSITQAINDASEGATIVLLANQESSIRPSKNITINLNNKTVYGQVGAYVSGKTFTVNGPGVLERKTAYPNVYNKGITNLNNCTIINSMGDCSVYSTNDTTTNINGCSITSSVANTAVYNNGTMTISSSSITQDGDAQTIRNNNGTMNISSNCTIAGYTGNRNIISISGGTVNLNIPNFSRVGTYELIYGSEGTLNILGGSINRADKPLIYFTGGLVYMKGGTITMTTPNAAIYLSGSETKGYMQGGTINVYSNGTSNYASWYMTNGAQFTYTSGTFNGSVARQYYL